MKKVIFLLAIGVFLLILPAVSISAISKNNQDLRVGDRVQSLTKLKIRQEPSKSGILRKTAPSGSKGTIVSCGSSTCPVVTNDLTWWKINWDSGKLPTGWSASGSSNAEYLSKITSTQSAKGTIIWAATLDGDPWTGSIKVNGTTPVNTVSNYSITTGKYPNAPTGAYSYTYVTGGPTGATFLGIGPSSSQTISANGTKTFTFKFESPKTQETQVPETQKEVGEEVKTVGTIIWDVMLDGEPWTGDIRVTGVTPVDYPTNHSVPTGTYPNAPTGRYTYDYVSGGPADATFQSVTPSRTQTLATNRTITFTFNFAKKKTVPTTANASSTGTIIWAATLNRIPWSGTITIKISDATSAGSPRYYTVHTGTYPGSPTGLYLYSELGYASGGPKGAIFQNITPSFNQTLRTNETITFTFNFKTKPN